MTVIIILSVGGCGWNPNVKLSLFPQYAHSYELFKSLLFLYKDLSLVLFLFSLTLPQKLSTFMPVWEALLPLVLYPRHPQLRSHTWKYFLCLLHLLMEKEWVGGERWGTFRLSLENCKLPLTYHGLLLEGYSFSGLGFSIQFVTSRNVWCFLEISIPVQSYFLILYFTKSL